MKTVVLALSLILEIGLWHAAIADHDTCTKLLQIREAEVAHLNSIAPEIKEGATEEERPALEAQWEARRQQLRDRLAAMQQQCGKAPE